MKCTNCGNEIPDGSAFCSACGTKVHNEYVVQDEEPKNQNNGGYRQNPQMNDMLCSDNGLAIASMVTGICSLVLSCCASTLSFILALVSCALGIYVLIKHKGGRGMAIAGITCSAVAIFAAVLVTVAYGFMSMFGYGYWY
ncbi:MAG: zinc-ribbon domain-containing protein [Oscillospiraceae bacterium]|nr:zinc-ribbon domain-containing protein [Oscillospiraceae bacterium]